METSANWIRVTELLRLPCLLCIWDWSRWDDPLKSHFLSLWYHMSPLSLFTLMRHVNMSTDWDDSFAQYGPKVSIWTHLSQEKKHVLQSRWSDVWENMSVHNNSINTISCQWNVRVFLRRNMAECCADVAETWIIWKMYVPYTFQCLGFFGGQSSPYKSRQYLHHVSFSRYKLIWQK